MDQAILNMETNTKERLQKMDKAFLNMNKALLNMEQAFPNANKTQQRFNIAMAMGLVVSGISFGISLFRMSIRLEGQFTFLVPAPIVCLSAWTYLPHF